MRDEFDDRDDQMSASDAARHFNVPSPKEKVLPDINKMSKEELEKLEHDAENSNDIYRVNARVMNLARGGGASLTQVGQMLCNTYTHVLVDLYAYAETLPPPFRDDLLAKLRRHEDMPANLLAAAKAGVR